MERMTPAEEMLRGIVREAMRGPEAPHQVTRIVFNSQLSPDEWRLLHQGFARGPFSWEAE
jgi:hypothetical protein